MDGILNLNKASGPTSFSCVSQVKYLLNEPRVGHGGTLDPLASGVLPVFLGQATRVSEYILEYSKTYRAEIELGVTTDTYDAEGRVVSHASIAHVKLSTLEAALCVFCGEISQKPPLYSAVKHAGQPLYKIARRGENIVVQSRLVKVYQLKLLDFNPPLFTIEIECNKGTYIRSVAHDLGQHLGCGAYLKNLSRVTYGPFDINHSVTLNRLEQAVISGCWEYLLYPLDSVLSVWPAVILSAEQINAVKHGSAIQLTPQEGRTRLRAYDGKGELLALLSYQTSTGIWQPHKVFRII